MQRIARVAGVNSENPDRARGYVDKLARPDYLANRLDRTVAPRVDEPPARTGNGAAGAAFSPAFRP